MSDLSKLEYALLCAARAFAACYQASEEKTNSKPAPQQKESITDNSGEIPKCLKHGKWHKPSKSGKGYYCVDCFIEKKEAQKNAGY